MRLSAFRCRDICKLLEGIGKAKATQDETFDGHAANLNKQSKTFERIYKDVKLCYRCIAYSFLLLIAKLPVLFLGVFVKAYAAALKALNQAERTLRDTIRESYEPEWPEREHLTAILDGETDPKVAKAFSELQQAESLYKEINNELLESLPAAYDNRIAFYVNTLQTLFNSHSVYQTECTKLNKQIVSQLDRLAESIDILRVPRPEPRPSTPTDSVNDMGSHRSTPSPAPAPPPATPASLADSTSGQPNASAGNPFEEDNAEEVFENKIYPKLAAVPPRADKEEEKNANETPKKVKDPTNPFDEDTDDEQQAGGPHRGPSDGTCFGGSDKRSSKGLGSVSCKDNSRVQGSGHGRVVVRAWRGAKGNVATMLRHNLDSTPISHVLEALSFKVLESKAEDQVDEGWQLGEKSDGTRGVFPENFTRRID
ncbi:BAR domain protein [Ancylostoma caninum]|uniref:BAR domain protein n=1 Tax=Ancylostoma caninum TaxID=29170 RepID=A0A368FXB5_ANCCA|nr:BAR domain protein [Ancylostoma caninum]